MSALGGIYARAAAGVDEDGGGGGQNANGDTAASGGGDIRGTEEGEGDEGAGGLEGLLASLAAPSPEAQSVLVDLGRTALKASGRLCVTRVHLMV